MAWRNGMLPRARRVQPKSGSWYGIKNVAGTAQVHIYNEIGGFGITADAFCRELSALDSDSIEVRINSPGGDVFDGIAIHGALARHPGEVHVHVDGVAASIASVIAMAGDRVTMARGSSMMIHEGHTVAVGPAAHMREQADLLDRVSDQIAGFYSARAGGDVGSWRGRMRKETWYSAEEAVQAGLADEVAAPSRAVKNTWDLSIFNYAGRQYAPAPDLDLYNHPGGPGHVQESHGRKKRGVPDLKPDVPKAPDGPRKAAPRKASPRRATPSRTPAPKAPARRGKPPAHAPGRVPNFSRMDENEKDQWFEDLTPTDWAKYSDRDKDRAWDAADAEWEKNRNPTWQEMLGEVDAASGSSKQNQLATPVASASAPNDTWTALISPLLTPSPDAVLAALLEAKK